MTARRRLAALAIAAWVSSSAAVACSSEGTTTGTASDAGGDAPDSPGIDASADVGLDSTASPGAPSLITLTVSASLDGGSPAPLALAPPFAPNVHDYSVRCAAGSNDLTVAMTASNGASSLLLQPIPSPSRAQQTFSVSVLENQAVVAAATDGAATVEYWIRCLPPDFPQLQWAVHPDAGTVTPGYYMVGTDQPTTSGCYAMVLDGNGAPVWYTQALPALGWCIFDVDSVVPGTVSFDSVVDSPAAFEVHQLSPPIKTRVAPDGMLNVDLHELLLLANGDYLVISSPLQAGVDVNGMQVLQLDGGLQTVTGTQSIMACNLLEIAPDGSVVWTWNATDHFDVLADSVIPQFLPYGPNAALVIDPIHCNSIDVEPVTGNLLVSARQMNSVFLIERATGKVLWKMGGAQASKDGATYVAVADPFVQQHDARFQSDWSPSCRGGSGHISLFDDQTDEIAPARAVVYDLDVGAIGAGDAGDAGNAGGTPEGGCGEGGAAPGTATITWQRVGSGPSLAMGSFRILPDGSRIIGWGDIPGAGFTEVDVDGNDLADLTFPDGNTTYRALKVPLAAFDLEALRSSAGLP
ncbi:MAG TPA: arylsulfotransferase family protein [Polyangiaceae bacterium]